MSAAPRTSSCSCSPASSRAACTCSPSRRAEIVRATVDVPVLTQITADMVETIRVSPADAPADAARSADEVVGTYAALPILAGETVDRRALERTPGERALGFGAPLASGQVAFALPVDPSQAVGAALAPGARVDVIAVPNALKTGLATGAGCEPAGDAGHGPGLPHPRPADRRRPAAHLGLSRRRRHGSLVAPKLGSVVIAIPAASEADFATAADRVDLLPRAVAAGDDPVRLGASPLRRPDRAPPVVRWPWCDPGRRHLPGRRPRRGRLRARAGQPRAHGRGRARGGARGARGPVRRRAPAIHPALGARRPATVGAPGRDRGAARLASGARLVPPVRRPVPRARRGAAPAAAPRVPAARRAVGPRARARDGRRRADGGGAGDGGPAAGTRRARRAVGRPRAGRCRLPRARRDRGRRGRRSRAAALARRWPAEIEPGWLSAAARGARASRRPRCGSARSRAPRRWRS